MKSSLEPETFRHKPASLKARVLTPKEAGALVELLDATDYEYWEKSYAKLFRAIRSKLTTQEEKE